MLESSALMFVRAYTLETSTWIFNDIKLCDALICTIIYASIQI
jgi:hypothetical protein